MIRLNFLKALSERYFSIALLCLLAGFVVFPSTKFVNNFYYVFLAIPALFLLLTGRVRWGEPRLSEILWMVFFIWLATIGWLGADGGFYKHLLYVAIFCVIVSRLVDPDVFDHPLVLRVCFWGLVAYVLVSVVWLWSRGQYFLGLRIIDLPSRLAGPIFTSMLMVGCYALLVPLWWRKRSVWEAVIGLGFVLLCIVFILQSRSGLVGLGSLLGVVGLWLLIRGSWRTRITVCIFAGTLSVICICFLYGTELGRSLIYREDSGRFSLWLDYLRQWGYCGWWLGCGYDYSGLDVKVNGQDILHPHSIYLSVGFYSGLVSMFLLLLALIVTVITGLRKRSSWGVFLLLSMIMLNFDGHKLIDSPNELWLLIWLPAMLIVSRSCWESNAGLNALPPR